MADWAQKVFWSEVSVGKVAEGYSILLDGREVRTPLKSKLYVPTEAFAHEIAKEWASLEEKVDPEKLPLTKIANAAIDKVSVQSDAIIPMLAEYATTDLLSYRAVSPEGLVERQQMTWDPLLDWFAKEYDVTLKTGTGVMPVEQAPDVLDVCSKILQKYTAFELAAVYDLITLSGSFVIGLATAQKRIDVSTAWAASRIDEEWQIEQWGEDEEATSLTKARCDAFKRSFFVLKMI
ncbi:ATPase [Amylibacter sp. SFDW26]|uniref:ATP12 family chaperone protein n=1 Tax=Amylibacter sp. SFDW26 TaxID=2652722 RepID=UPI001262666E|nr:ATP12 family protein [Amylibacter sp. SFDW26]KAB7613284.1 ATPase [Amylibacter sp. SFDW26]